MGSAVAVSWWLMQNGTAPALAILGPQIAAFVIVAVFEHVYPYHASWNLPRADVSVDARHAIGIGILLAVITPLAVTIGVAVGGWLSAQIGMGLWPSEWPLLAQIALALVIGELPGYWIHRWQHEWEGLWRFHAVHHSAPRLYWLNAGRFHPIDSFMTFAPSYFAAGNDGLRRSGTGLLRVGYDYPWHFPARQYPVAAGTAQLVFQHGGAAPLASLQNAV
ncbi:MAG: sterol desaturase family protein [Haliea sp.]|nr:sterol desaturase family protein [Haliea sp.]